MFRVLEKNGELRPVYSKSDLEYMAGRGWREVNIAEPEPVAERVVAHTPKTKRKYTRRAK
jgi:hypothetical protein